MEEFELSEQCRLGNNRARKELYEHYGGRLLGVCLRYTGDRDTAQDLLHDGFIKIFSSFDKFTWRGEGSLRAWMERVMVNTALQYLRKSDVISQSTPLEEVPEDYEEPDASAVEMIPQAVLMRFIEELPAGYRTVFNLYTFEEKSHKEIAQLLGINEKSSASQLFRAKIGEVLMEVKDWTVHHPLYSDRKVVDNVNLNVRKGEVVGISGLMGAGRTELAMSLFGKSYGSNISGELYINGQIVNLNSVQEAIKNRLAYVTEDRKGNGLILSNPIKINTTLANLDAVSSHTVIDKDKEYNVAVDYKKKLNTKCPTVEQNVGNLSGGNQQKVLLAKWMFADPDILILDEPTRGIDVGAKYEIYCIINQLVAEGKSVIMISSELPEILGMCDRIYVMNEGKIVGELAGSEATQELIMSKILSAGKKGALA